LPPRPVFRNSLSRPPLYVYCTLITADPVAASASDDRHRCPYHPYRSYPLKTFAADSLSCHYLFDREPGGGFQGLPAATSHRRIPRSRPHIAASPAESARSPAAILQCDPESGGGQRRLWPWCLASSSPAPEPSRRN